MMMTARHTKRTHLIIKKARDLLGLGDESHLGRLIPEAGVLGSEGMDILMMNKQEVVFHNQFQAVVESSSDDGF